MRYYVIALRFFGQGGNTSFQIKFKREDRLELHWRTSPEGSIKSMLIFPGDNEKKSTTIGYIMRDNQ